MRSDQNAAEAASGVASAVVNQLPPVVISVITAHTAVVNAVSAAIWRSLKTCMRGMLPRRGSACVYRHVDAGAHRRSAGILSIGRFDLASRPADWERRAPRLPPVTRSTERVRSAAGRCGVLAADVAPEIVAAIAARRARGARWFLGVRFPSDFDPSSLLDDPAARRVVASYERPGRGMALVAVGEAGRATVPPGAAQPAARGAIRALLAPESDAEAPELRPRLLGGFAFDGRRPPRAPWTGFAAGSFVLPRLLFVRDGAVSGVVVAPGVDPGEVEVLLGGTATESAPPGPLVGGALRVAHDFDRERWLTSVAAVAGAVRTGLYEKVVLAAMRELEADGLIEPGAALACLRTEYPDCHLFSFKAGDATFLGASPELLVSLRGGAVLALGLAGSARRDRDAAIDAHLGQALLDSAKDRIEHETVVRALRESLAPVTTEVRAPNQPSLLRLRNIQHLATEVTARAADGVDVLALVERLHPTPAVCGSPTEAARVVIDSHEAFDRGWYAGPIGWLDGAGDGEFAVGLRSALVRGSHAWLFAGAGIMGDSRPADELAEIEMKFTPLAGALAGAAV